VAGERQSRISFFHEEIPPSFADRLSPHSRVGEILSQILFEDFGYLSFIAGH
jgi:hypothetical protein